MASQRDFLELSGSAWLAELARSDGVPGAGSALAAAVACAAAVAGMAARVSGDGGLVAQADALCARTAPLAGLDAETYRAALDAREELAELEGPQRDFLLGRAFALAAEPPLAIARAAADVAELAAQLAVSGEPRVRADAIAAGALAAGAARGAVALVEVNLTTRAGDERVAEVERLAEAAERAIGAARG
ncbi:MAG TPA: cyclodeaminase/cyclohydrolase family protein [Gaiellaceae bacterium]|nr:cyclodeaminase/cyclohydrolase family protein [Gaiellaceae bacterium]